MEQLRARLPHSLAGLLLLALSAQPIGASDIYEAKTPYYPGARTCDFCAAEGVPSYFYGTPFSLRYQLSSVGDPLTAQQKLQLDKAFHTINWIIQHTPYGQKLSERTGNPGIAKRLYHTSLIVNVEVVENLRYRNRNILGLATPGKRTLKIRRSRFDRPEPIDAARTLLHESSHIIGFRHNRNRKLDFIGAFGKTLQYFYDRNKTVIHQSYEALSQ